MLTEKDFPEAIRPLMSYEEVAWLPPYGNVRWTYITGRPASAVFLADGPLPAYGDRRFHGEWDGKSAISYADYAIAMVDETKHESTSCERISVRQAKNPTTPRTVTVRRPA